MVEVDTCPLSVVIPDSNNIRAMDFFTDSSSLPNKSKYNFSGEGAYGFVYVDKQFNLKYSFLRYSLIHNNTYLECLAIYHCLIYIQCLATYYSGIKYYIFTDSSSSYDSLKQSFYKRPDKIKQGDWFQRQVFECNRLIEFMAYQGIDIHIIDIKGHCNPIKQRTYLNSKGFDFDLEYCKLISYGNKVINDLVYDCTKNRHLHQYVQYDN